MGVALHAAAEDDAIKRVEATNKVIVPWRL